MTGTMNWSDYTVRAGWAAEALSKAAMGELGIAGVVCLAGGAPFLVLWLVAAGLMTIPLAGAFSWSGKFVEHSRGKTLRLYAMKAPSRRPSICVRVCNRVRACRRASRTVFAHSADSGSGGDSGESDSGDPSEPSHHTALPLNLFQLFYSKPNIFSFRLWRFLCRPGRWCLPCCKYAARRWAA